MSFPGPGRGRGSDSGNNHVVMSAGRGAILVAVAVVAGLLVLAAVRDSKSSGSATESPSATTQPVVTTVGVPSTNLDGTPAATSGTTATTKPKKTTSTTTKGGNARPNDQVVVQVLNGSGLQGAATTKTNDLKAKGYQTASAGNAVQQNGTTVQCKAGYEKEATELVNQLATLGTTATVQPIANPLPSGFEPTANCYVLLGK
jgi:LytR cell envelope-related transcriptional attenuator